MGVLVLPDPTGATTGICMDYHKHQYVYTTKPVSYCLFIYIPGFRRYLGYSFIDGGNHSQARRNAKLVLAKYKTDPYFEGLHPSREDCLSYFSLVRIEYNIVLDRIGKMSLVDWAE